MKGKILLVEDEKSIRGFLKINLKRSGLEVVEAETGEEGIRKAKIEKPSIALLDVMLPGIDGFQVCKELRQEFPSMGIIMLTARTQDMDKIMGLEFGADDYVVKPFNPSELILRIKALLRRIDSTDSTKENILVSSIFKINTYSQKIYKNEKEIDVTPKEYMILKIFLENEEKAFSRDELLDLVWGYDFVGDPKIVDVNIRRLRAKIEDEPSNPKYIETVWGKGYRWRKL
ncbi:DNA-binding response regulator [Clostridium tetani]|uniref:Stage 0 sporulation protein A homolog n=1 Tax=Clostridium tetani TaxID=1513 RepID=A0A4Q0V1U9_CLOTA|nr:response regulator transcription factor [Clostridium tetani]RXI40293.1 DNA-binding response regulator [Clostridium tetani]RXI50014.1 DNA-binding response regulator [Clostridium tetani]BDR81672.1 DNA-binding response regulator [Clostridium tetani]BDR90054.1 DNA-binding response regulator [Clostridium tetani]